MSKDVQGSFEAAFFVVPSRIMSLPGLTITYLKVYETIFQFWNHGRECYLSDKAIMNRTGIESDGTLRKAYMFFERHGEMIRETINGQRFLTQPTRRLSTGGASTVPNGTPDRSKRNGSTVPNGTHNNKNINNKNINNKKKALAVDNSFKPTAHNLDIARKLGLNVIDERERFIDHYSSKGETRRDWGLVFNNWLKNKNDFNQRNKRSGNKQIKNEPKSTVPWFNKAHEAHNEAKTDVSTCRGESISSGGESD